MQKRDWQSALSDYSEAIDLDSRNADLLCRRAACLIELNEFDKAMADAERALLLEPKSEGAAKLRRQVIAAKNARLGNASK